MTKDKKKVILTGYRATGKSTVGRILADKLGWLFMDTDREIEKREGCSIAQMVAEQGWDFFRGLERDILLELVPVQNIVIACGGGAILHKDAWETLKAVSLVVWLTADPETICQRLAADSRTADQRPALTDSDIFNEVREVLAQRQPLYRQGSHLEIATTIPAAEIADQIAAELAAS